MQTQNQEASTSTNTVIRAIIMLIMVEFFIRDLHYHGLTEKNIVCMSGITLMLLGFAFDEIFPSGFNWFGWSIAIIACFGFFFALFPVISYITLGWLGGSVIASIIILKVKW